MRTFTGILTRLVTAVLFIATLSVLREHWQLRTRAVSSQPATLPEAMKPFMPLELRFSHAAGASSASVLYFANATLNSSILGEAVENRGGSPRSGDKSIIYSKVLNRFSVNSSYSRNHDRPERSISSKSLLYSANSSAFQTLPRHCDLPWIHRYTALHSRIIHGHAPPNDTRYLIMRPHSKAGLGNRMRAILGALSLAVLTDRALILDFGPRANQTEAQFLEPALIDWRLPVELTNLSDSVGNVAGVNGHERQRKWAHGWSPFISESDLDRLGNRKLRKDGVLTVWHNKDNFFRTAAPKELWPEPKVLVVASQNHDVSKALFSNAQISSLLRKAKIVASGRNEDATVTLGSWNACALRMLFQPGPLLTEAACQVARKQQTDVENSSNAHLWRPLLTLHLRSEGRHASNITMWNEVVSTAVACAHTVEVKLLAALTNFTRRRCASLELRPSVMKAACANANRFLSSANRRRSNSSSEIQPQWLVMADRQELVEMVRSMVPDRVVALDSSVRVHSGLQKGGEGRVMGSSLGPLTDLLTAGRALGIVGTAGSSFSEMAASFALEPPIPWAQVMVRTPFIKSYQGKGLTIDQARNFCNDIKKASHSKLPRLKMPAKANPWQITKPIQREVSEHELNTHVERSLLGPLLASC